jgi:hypothetical protein
VAWISPASLKIFQTPDLVKALANRGTLQECLEGAVELTIISLQQREKQGLAPGQATEIPYQNLYLPSPED